MDRLIYTAMTGANAAANRQAVISNNLANVSTTGFRAELATYRSVPLRGDGATTRVFALEATAGQLNTPGQAIHTDNSLDVMAGGSSWLTVQGLDGNEAYTRNGHFEISTDGTLVTSSGLPVLGSGGSPITVPTGAEVSIGKDGTVTAKLQGQPSNSVGKLKLITPTQDDPVQRSDDGLFRTASGDPANADEKATVTPGVLEGSNVNSIESIIGMIQTARQFESQTRLIQMADSNDRSASRLLSTSG